MNFEFLGWLEINNSAKTDFRQNRKIQKFGNDQQLNSKLNITFEMIQGYKCKSQ